MERALSDRDAGVFGTCRTLRVHLRNRANIKHRVGAGTSADGPPMPPPPRPPTFPLPPRPDVQAALTRTLNKVRALP